jgi:hypothetical protein
MAPRHLINADGKPFETESWTRSGRSSTHLGLQTVEIFVMQMPEQ